MDPSAAVVLIVDDHPTMRGVIKSNLTQLGVNHIFEAEGGQQALQLLQKNPINCVISDWNMPGMNGLELLLSIRADNQFCKLLFMMVTAEADRENIQQAISAGVDEFLVKPFTPATLSGKAQRLLQKNQHSQNSAAALTRLPSSITQGKTASAAPGKHTILVVDDTPTNIDVITGLLKDEYRILAVTSGEKALKIVHTKPPALILLDIMMPEMDGYEVCRRLKADPTTEDIPVIFLTAKTEVKDITQGFDLGAVDYISKPVNGKVLKARVRTQLKLKKARDDLSEQVDILTENARLREDIERMTRHDLKSPLTAIINTSAMLMENRWLGAEQLQEIDTIQVNAFDILTMIERSLDLYKMETGQYQLNASELNLAQVCQRAVEAERLNAKKKSVKILYEAPEEILCQGEELLCLSLLGNLLKNAVEASPASENVKVSLFEQEDQVCLLIHNQGEIPAEIKETFFEKYTTAGKSSGTGLGTYSAKLMSQIQGGEISFTSSAQAGTELKVALPRSP